VIFADIISNSQQIITKAVGRIVEDPPLTPLATVNRNRNKRSSSQYEGSEIMMKSDPTEFSKDKGGKKGTIASPRTARDDDTASISIASNSFGGRSTSTGGNSDRSGLSYATSTNIWAKLIGTNESVWDGLDGREDVYDDPEEDLVTVKSGYYDDIGICGTAPLRVCCIGAWYETRHFFRTLGKHPVIILVSLAVFGLICGLGMWAVQSEREAYIKDKMDTAKFVVSYFYVFFYERGERVCACVYVCAGHDCCCCYEKCSCGLLCVCGRSRVCI
jgi:hypothetical protein